MGVVLSTLHVKVKFRTEQGIVVIRDNQQVARHYLVAVVDRGIKQKESNEEIPLEQLQGPQEEVRASCAEDLVRVKILPDDDRSFLIGASIKDNERVEMLFLM